VFTANTQFDVFACGAATLYSGLNQFANALEIDGLERIARQQTAFNIGLQESACVITAEPKAHLSQVIRPEGEELSGLGNFVGDQAGAWDFDHGSEHVRNFYAQRLGDFFVDLFG